MTERVDQWKTDYLTLIREIEAFEKKYPVVHPKITKALAYSRGFLWGEIMNCLDNEE